MKELKDYLYKLFPTPDHRHFELLPQKEQWKIIGQGQVMTEIENFIKKDEI